jgi:hypothetical protein
VSSFKQLSKLFRVRPFVSGYVKYTITGNRTSIPKNKNNYLHPIAAMATGLAYWETINRA